MILLILSKGKSFTSFNIMGTQPGSKQPGLEEIGAFKIFN